MKLYPNDPASIKTVIDHYCKKTDDALLNSTAEFEERFKEIIGFEMPQCLNDLMWSIIGAALDAGANNQTAEIVESNPEMFRICKRE